MPNDMTLIIPGGISGFLSSETFAFILSRDARLIMKHKWHVIIALIKFHLTYLSPRHRADLHAYFQHNLLNLFPASFRTLLFKSLHNAFIYFRRQEVRKDSFWEILSMYRTPDPNGNCQANVTHPFQHPALLLIYRKKCVDSKWFNHALYFPH